MVGRIPTVHCRQNEVPRLQQTQAIRIRTRKPALLCLWVRLCRDKQVCKTKGERPNGKDPQCKALQSLGVEKSVKTQQTTSLPNIMRTNLRTASEDIVSEH